MINNHRVVHQQSSPSGDFTFLALESGEYKICLQSQVNNWVGKTKTKLEVEFEVGFECHVGFKKERYSRNFARESQYIKFENHGN